MTFVNKLISELILKNNDLYKSFFPKSNYNFRFQDIRSFKKFNTVVIIGMGGSILGSKAIYSFLKYKIKKKFLFIDNLDESLLVSIKKKYKLKKSLFLIVSKSGNTSETIINVSFFKPFLKKTNTIIISENKNNFLRNLSRNEGFSFIRHNPFIGGRYSVFSDVGMLPAFLMGLKPEKFKKNLPKIIKKKKILSKSANMVSKLNLKKYKTLIFFNYIPELNDFLFWCQQLMAESLGKKKNGFIPVISNAPKDHHSLLQLYLDGPKDKIFYIFSSKEKRKIKINSNFLEKKMQHLNKKSYENIKLSQKNAFLKTLKEKKIPFREIIIKKFDENTIGELFFLFIFETIVLGKIMKINPFDQPAVERVKILTKKNLVSKKS